MFKSSSLRLCTRAFFVFIALILAVPLQSADVQAADWYNSSWSYRKSIVIDQTDDLGADAAYQMKLLVGKSSSASGENVDCADHCEADFDDLRFTKSDGTTLLDYWIESISGSGSSALATVWIETILLDNAADTTIYMYYGNASASAASNGDNTFVFFDDFSGAYPGTKWTGTTALGTVADGILTCTGNGNWRTMCSTISASSTTTALYCYAQINSAVIASFGFSNTTNTHYSRFYVDGTNSNLQSSDGTTGSNVVSNLTLNAYRNFHILVRGSTNMRAFDNNVEVTGSPKTTNPSNVIMPIAINTNTADVNILVDWIFITKFTATEPTWKSYGSEEANAPTVTTQTATNVEETTATGNGNITSLSGGDNCTVRGFQYDIDTGVPYANSASDNGSFGTGAYTKALTGLTKGELYYIRAYATSPLGTGYGSEVTFLTKPDAPTGLTATAFSETQINLSWTKGTGAQKTVIIAKEDSYPADRTDGAQIYNDTGTSCSHTDLTEGEHWYYRAWSYTTESTLEQYSDSYAEDNEQTRVPLSITTGICSGSSETWAILNSEITTADPLPVTVRGFDYGLTTGYGSDVLESGSFGLGTYKLFVENISKSTVFHYRAKAYNGVWKYGADRVFATKGSPALWEYFDTTADNTSTVYGANWYAQTFTTDNVTSRTVTSIILPLQRTGNSGDVIVSLRDTAGGKPTGIDLCYGVLSQDEIPTGIMDKCQFTMNKETPLQLGTQYAIVVKAPNGDASNYVKWDYVNAGGEPNGTGLTSVNSGIAWTIQTWDYLFEIWGNQAIEIQDAKVFQSYKSIGDWLITVRYVNLFAPYYDTYDVRQYFVLQLVDSADHVIAQSPLPAWGNRVGNLYLSAAQVSALDYGGSYTLRIYGTFGSHPYTEYIIQSSDWKGDDLTQLDSWVITSAAVIGDYYDDLLTTYVAGRGEVLNATGGTIFSAGINGLSTVRPALYQVYTNPIDYVPETTDQSQRVAMSNWQAAWGADGTIMITRIANWFGIDGGLIGGMFFVIMMLVLALVAFPAGHTTAANVLSIPCLGLAVWFGLDLVWLIILALFAAFLLFKNQFMDK